MGQRPYGAGALLRAGGALVGGLDGRAPLEKQSLPSPSPSLLSIFPEGRRIRSINSQTTINSRAFLSARLLKKEDPGNELLPSLQTFLHTGTTQEAFKGPDTQLTAHGNRVGMSEGWRQAVVFLFGSQVIPVCTRVWEPLASRGHGPVASYLVWLAPVPDSGPAQGSSALFHRARRLLPPPPSVGELRRGDHSGPTHPRTEQAGSKACKTPVFVVLGIMSDDAQ